MRVDGSCHCGKIRFEADVNPEQISICHCTDCQKLSGSAFRANVSAPAAGFRILTGEPKSYIKTAESGTKRRHAFCGDCGTPIYAAAPENPESFSLRIGTLAQHALLKPYRQIWRRSALPWVDRLADVPGRDKG